LLLALLKREMTSLLKFSVSVRHSADSCEPHKQKRFVFFLRTLALSHISLHLAAARTEDVFVAQSLSHSPAIEMDRKLRISSWRWRRRIFLLSLLAASVATSSAFVRARLSTFSLSLSVAAPSALEQMTVKELRQLLKDAHLQERGLLSRLKRKQDLVDYLSENLPQSNGVNGDTDTNGASSPPPTKRIHKKPLNMPPLEDISPKDILFEQLYQKYPPLRNAVDTNSDEPDLRQLHHPMLKNATASDMDIIFLGTASCTPGLTRGVSCTALRLNWRRRCLQTDGRNIPDYSSFTGGTWLFDVGECTQVRRRKLTCSLFFCVQVTKYEMLAPVRGQQCSRCPMVMFVFLQTLSDARNHKARPYGDLKVVSP
jgi:hypothetical protein